MAGRAIEGTGAGKARTFGHCRLGKRRLLLVALHRIEGRKQRRILLRRFVLQLEHSREDIRPRLAAFAQHAEEPTWLQAVPHLR